MSRTDHDPIPVTAARARLFEIVEDVLTGRRSRVAISLRGHAEQVVVVRETEIEGLRADLEALRARGGSEPRKLRGLGTLHVDAERVLERTRARQAELARAKRGEIAGGDAVDGAP